MEYRNPKDLKPHPVSVELYGNNNIEDIRESIANLGILVPLTITKDNLIISGHRRWRCAIELELERVPIEVKSFASELDEKRSILEFNKQRDKTFSQKTKELTLAKDIEVSLAQSRIEATQFQSAGCRHMETATDKGKSLDIAAKQVGLGSATTARKAEQIVNKAQEGNIEAKELIRKLDADEITINKAYTDIFDKAHVSHNTGENEWYTPKVYIEATREVMGTIDLDPASSDIANETIKATKYYTIQDDGMRKEWAGNIWLNPPYSQPLISDFCDLLVKNYKEHKIQQACVLVNNATETNFHQNMLSCCQAVCFIKGRIKFIDKEGKESGAPLQGQTILYFGKNRDKFAQSFTRFGVVLHAR